MQKCPPPATARRWAVSGSGLLRARWRASGASKTESVDFVDSVHSIGIFHCASWLQPQNGSDKMWNVAKRTGSILSLPSLLPWAWVSWVRCSTDCHVLQNSLLPCKTFNDFNWSYKCSTASTLGGREYTAECSPGESVESSFGMRGSLQTRFGKCSQARPKASQPSHYLSFEFDFLCFPVFSCLSVPPSFLIPS